MIKIKEMSETFLNILLISVSAVITLLTILGGPSIKSGSDIDINGIANKKYRATRDVVNQVATEKLKKEAAASVPDYYRRNTEIEEEVKKNINNFFAELDKYRKEYIAKVEEQQALQNNTEETINNKIIMTTKLPIEISDKIKTTLFNFSEKEYSDYKQKVIESVEDIFDVGIKDKKDKALEDTVDKEIKDHTRQQFDYVEEQNLAYSIISSYIKPNMIFDLLETESSRDKKVSEVQPVIILQYQTIVDEGQPITEEIYEVLNSLGFVQKSFVDLIWVIVGAVCIVLVMFSIIVYYIYNFPVKNLSTPIEKNLFFTLYNTCIFSMWVLRSVPQYLLPILVFTMLIAILIDKNLALLMNICFATIAILSTRLEYEFFIFFIISGTLLTLLSNLVTERSKIIVVGLISSIVNGFLVVGINLFTHKEPTEQILATTLFIVLYSMFSIIVSLGSLPFWEAAFGAITTIKLLDLTNPASPVLKRLTVEAPGTYHHSLIVANLAEAAAIDIDANPILARVGGYYHDIGKLKYPQYFSENQASENPHDLMDPYDSAKVIKSHVSYGVELVEFYRLPKVIKDMVTMHHGNTLIKYFYFRAKKMDKYKDTEIIEEDFRYPYQIPQYKEAAIVMLADTIEAAVRSMIPSGKTMQEVEEFVAKLVKDKLDDNQLQDSMMTIKDLDTIIKSFMRVFKGMYHERITYPSEDKKTEDKSANEEEKNLGETEEEIDSSDLVTK